VHSSVLDHDEERHATYRRSVIFGQRRREEAEPRIRACSLPVRVTHVKTTKAVYRKTISI
jgi:hypothetical protein